MDTVFITGLKAASVIGCYDWERDIRQTLVIDLELQADFGRAAGNRCVRGRP
jgi:dihydroneopterin aldolase